MKQDGTTTKRALTPFLKRAADNTSNRNYKRDNKNRPMEMSSKRPVPRLREVMQVTKRLAPKDGPSPLMAVRLLQFRC